MQLVNAWIGERQPLQNEHITCSHCGKQVQVFYANGARRVKIDYDSTTKLHILRKKE